MSSWHKKEDVWVKIYITAATQFASEVTEIGRVSDVVMLLSFAVVLC